MLHSFDWWVIGAYFAAVFVLAFSVSRSERTRSNAQEYFLAGRHTGWFVIGASLFASNIGSEHLVGLAGTGAASGLAVGQFEVLASLILLLLGWVFVPFYVRSAVVTMPEFLERRYSAGARAYLAGISILGYVLTKISVTIYAGGIVFETLMGIDFWTGALIVVVATGVYTIFGGLRAVLYTDLLQMFVLIGGALAVTVVGLNAVGGWSELRASVPTEYFSVWRPADDPDFPWTGIVFGAPILGVWYWCTDQFIVQRVLAARGIDEARKGTIFAGFLKLLPLFIFVLPGVIAASLANSGRLTLGQPDEALPALVSELLPVGLRGLVVAGLLAALMSSLSSVLNSCSTLVTWDIYGRMRPSASQKQLVTVGQIVTLALVGLALLWIPFMENISGRLYQYMQSVQAYISPPIAAVFLLGILSKSMNGKGAMASLMTGFVLGMGRLVLELNKGALPAGPLLDYASMNFLHFAVFLFLVCTAVLVSVSLVTAPMDRNRLFGLTFQTLPSRTEWAVRGASVTWSVVLVACVALVWIVFR